MYKIPVENSIWKDKTTQSTKSRVNGHTVCLEFTYITDSFPSQTLIMTNIWLHVYDIYKH